MTDAVFPVSGDGFEPLVHEGDLNDYRDGLAKRLAGDWDEERWTAYRVRFGVYGQRQEGVQMVRIKIPGGIVPTAWLKSLAAINRSYCDADAHVTTRQDIQIYGVPLGRTADLLAELNAAGLTTREACGNTLRNMTGCALSGSCPSEHVDAGQVASQLARSWLRHPLVQHMPRKMKLSVSGCATDCASAPIHDIGLIATEKDGAKGFKVFAGGGLGAAPRMAIEVADFVVEEELPTVIEALVRLHQRYSDRINRNAARLKFVVKRFGDEKFVALFTEEFARLKGLPHRPWEKLAWRDPSPVAVDRNPLGVIPAHDGTKSVSVYVPLGLLSSDQLDGLADVAVAAGVTQLRTTQTQNVIFLGVTEDKLATVITGVKALGLDVPEAKDAVPHVISCPGTTTCRIGITSSQSLAREVELQGKGDVAAAQVSVHISGCPNSCGLHHVADIGLHGAAKKVDGRAAPHYQFFFGGDPRTGTVGMFGPIVPARQADEAIKILRDAAKVGLAQGESVRAWAERLGRAGLKDLLAPLDGRSEDGLFVDWGEEEEYGGPSGLKGECAATFASADLLADLADDGLIQTDRLIFAGRVDEARAWAIEAAAQAARLYLAKQGINTPDDIAPKAALEQMTGSIAGRAALSGALARIHALETGELSALREAVATFVDAVRAAVDGPAPVAAAAMDLSDILGAAE